MRAVAYHSFGSPDVLRLEDVPVPALPDDGLLVSVRAASVNVLDIRTRRGLMSPFVNKKFPKVPGIDFSGVVTAVGRRTQRWKPGDEVYGAGDAFRGGALAELVAVRQNDVALKPKSLGFEASAALPVTGQAALQSLRDLGKVGAQQRILLYGSSGGVGLLAIQLAKQYGAHVTAVSGPEGIAPSRNAGADLTIDYTAGPVKPADHFDLIIDFSSHFPFAVARPYLAPAGRFVEPSPTIPKVIGSMLANPFRKQKHLMLMGKSSTRDLEFLGKLVDQGKLTVKVAKVFPLESVREAFAAHEAGGVIGKIVVTVARSVTP